jgi:hypothetical protein
MLVEPPPIHDNRIHEFGGVRVLGEAFFEGLPPTGNDRLLSLDALRGL